MFDDLLDDDVMDSMPIEQQEELYRETNPDYFVKVDLTDRTRLVTFTCKRCGYLKITTRPNKNYTISECPGCMEKVKNQNYIGLCKENLVGRVYNGMEIIAQYTEPVQGYLCDIKCAVCGREDSIKKGASVIDVFRYKYFHDCDYSKVVCRCSNCYSATHLSIKEIMDSKDNLCQECGYVLDKSDIKLEVAAYDRKLNFKNAIKKTYGTTASPEMRMNNYNIYYEKDPIYRSLNDDYYRCICIRHFSKFVLTETELMNYSCEKCHDVQEGIFKPLKAHKVLRSINNPKEASVWKWDAELRRFVRQDNSFDEV